MNSVKLSEDPRMKDGMNKDDRACTDILCLIVFLAFIGAMGYATMYGFKHGDIEKLIGPIAGLSATQASSGVSSYVICGQGITQGYDKLYF